MLFDAAVTLLCEYNVTRTVCCRQDEEVELMESIRHELLIDNVDHYS